MSLIKHTIHNFHGFIQRKVDFMKKYKSGDNKNSILRHQNKPECPNIYTYYLTNNTKPYLCQEIKEPGIDIFYLILAKNLFPIDNLNNHGKQV